MAKKTAKKTAEKELKRYQEAAADLNTGLDLDPPIEWKEASKEELMMDLEDIIPDINYGKDKEVLDEETLILLQELGLEVPEDDSEAEEAEDDSEAEEEDPEEEDPEEEEEAKQDPKKNKGKGKGKKKKEPESEPEEDEPEEEMSLQMAVAKGKTEDLKTLVKEYDEFKKLRKGLDNYKGLEGFRDLKAKMQDIVGKPEGVVTREPKAGKKNSKPGIIATIREVVKNAGKGGVSKDEILDELKDKFPERDPDAMKKTINVQVPARIKKEAFDVVTIKGEDGPKYKAA